MGIGIGCRRGAIGKGKRKRKGERGLPLRTSKGKYSPLYGYLEAETEKSNKELKRKMFVKGGNPDCFARSIGRVVRVTDVGKERERGDRG